VKQQTARKKILLRGRRCLSDLPFSADKVDKVVEQAVEKMNKLNGTSQKLVFEVYSGDEVH